MFLNVPDLVQGTFLGHIDARFQRPIPSQGNLGTLRNIRLQDYYLGQPNLRILFSTGV
jgi:hypothetical protein